MLTVNADFSGLPRGEADVTVIAPGFEDLVISGFPLEAQFPRLTLNFRLTATGEWAVGRAFVLGTRMLELANDGTEMTFEVDVAVIGENSEAIQTLTSDVFALHGYECGWLGGRDCASDSEGRPTGASGQIWAKSGAEQFGLQPPSARHSYLAGVLVERSTEIIDWDERGPALKTFFSGLGGNDVANLASMQVENDATTLDVLGPYTSDGSTFLAAIDQLAMPAGGTPDVLDSLLESLRRAAEASTNEFPGTEPSVLLVSTPWISLADIYSISEFATELGVQINVIRYGYPQEASEIALRTGGFAVTVADARQLGMVFGALDGILAGTTAYYRMQFRVGGEAGTFVSGGNARMALRIRVPASIPHWGVSASLDVAIP